MHEIQYADPRARRWAVLLVLFGTLAGLAGIWLIESSGPALQAWLTGDAEQIRSRVWLLFAVLTLSVAVPVFGLAVYFWHLGGRIIRAARVPLPGMLVMRDTVVLRGIPARRCGRFLQLAAVMLAAAAVAFPLLLWRLLSLLDLRAA